MDEGKGLLNGDGREGITVDRQCQAPVENKFTCASEGRIKDGSLSSRISHVSLFCSQMVMVVGLSRCFGF